MFRKRINKIWIIGLLLFLLGLSACDSESTPGAESIPIEPTITSSPPTATSEPMAVIVNGEGITVVEFDAEVQRFIAAQNALGKDVSSADATSTVLQDFISQLLLSQAAHAQGFTLDDVALQGRIDALAAQVGGAEGISAWQQSHGYNEQAFRSALKRAAEASWMRDRIISNVPGAAEQVHVQQILLYNQDKAQEFLTQLNSGADFDELALIADPLTRGDLGWVPRGYLLNQQIEDVAFGLDAGKYSDVIATDVGYHIVKVLERDPNRQLSPDASIALRELALKNWIEEQKKNADVVLVPN